LKKSFEKFDVTEAAADAEAHINKSEGEKIKKFVNASDEQK